MNPVLYAENFPRIHPVLQLPDKGVIVGANGSGKSTILNAICVALTGRLFGGGKPTEINKDARARLENIETKPPVYDLKSLAALTGPARAEYLFSILGGKATVAQMEAALYPIFPPHLRDNVTTIIGKGDIDESLKAVNAQKKELDNIIAGLRALANREETISKSVATRELELLRKRLAGVDDSKRRELSKELAGLIEKLGDKAEKKTSEIESKLQVVNGNITDLSDRLKVEKDSLNRLDAEARSLNQSVKVLRELDAPTCPTCGQSVTSELIELIASKAQAATAKHAEYRSVVMSIETELTKWQNHKKTGDELLKNLREVARLRSELKALPESRYTPEEIKDLREREAEFVATLAAIENSEKASATLAKCEDEASRMRKAEAALKKLKADIAQGAGFPESVQNIISTTLGWTLEFGNAGRTMDILIRDEQGTRGLSTASAGEWQIIAAAFGAMKHDAAILVEAAEIDSENYGKLQKALSAHKGLVYIADCHGRNPENWKVIE